MRQFGLKILGITVVAIAMSMIITMIVVWLLQPSDSSLMLSVAFICPLLIAPPLSSYYFRQSALLDALVTQLNKAHAELKSAYSQVEEQARLDGLTGLLNRSAFVAVAEQMIARETRGVLLLLDIDHFKSINDTYGHSAGDSVLARTAACIKEMLDGEAVIGRLGGEEFGVLLPGASPHQSFHAAERVRIAVHRNIATPDNDGKRLTISIGYAAYGGAPFQNSFEEADANLYRAKHGGRNQTSGSSRAA